MRFKRVIFTPNWLGKQRNILCRGKQISFFQTIFYLNMKPHFLKKIKEWTLRKIPSKRLYAKSLWYKHGKKDEKYAQSYD